MRIVFPWRPLTPAQLVAEHPRLPFSPYYILGHIERKWIRFGRYYPACRRWYYSGTNERSQWAQAAGDEPTHWMPMPAI